MTIIEKIKNENFEVVIIDDFRKELKKIVSNYYKEIYELNDCTLYYIESLIFRGIALDGISNITEQDIIFMLSIIKLNGDIKKNIACSKNKGIEYSLWNCLYNYLDEELFELDDQRLKYLKENSVYLPKLLDLMDYMEQGNIPYEIHENLSVYKLKLAISEFLELIFQKDL